MRLLSILVPAPTGVDVRTVESVQIRFYDGEIRQYMGREVEVQEARVSAPVRIESLGRVV